MMAFSDRKTATAFVVLALFYWIAAVIGLQWAIVHGAGTPVWPAAGVALAGLLIGGRRLWTAIVIARLLAGFSAGSSQPFWAEFCIALGNGLGALLAVWAMERFGHIDRRLARIHDVIWLAVGVAVQGVVSGALGVIVLASSSDLALLDSFSILGNWLSGDAVGGLTVAPLILSWYDRPNLRFRDAIYLALVMLITSAAAALIFLSENVPYLRTWHTYPFLIWAAVSFQVRGASLALVMISIFAIASADLQLGPFLNLVASAGTPMMLAQQFVALSSLVILLLAAAVDERVAKETLSLALEAGQLGLWDSDFSTGRVQYGGQWAEMLGYDADELAPTMSTWERIIHPDDRDAVMERLNNHLAGTSAFYDCEHRLRHKNGTWRWILTRGRVVERDAQGQPLRIVGTHSDITARKEAEATAKRWLHLVEGVMSAAPAAIYIHNCQTHQNELVSRKAHALLGYTEAEWSTLTDRTLNLFHPDDLPRFHDHIERISNTNGSHVAEFEYRMRHSDGSWRWFLSRDLPYERSLSGDLVLLLGVAVDITERKLAEAALQESELRLRQALEGADAGVWELALDTRCQYWSSEYRKLFGFEQEIEPSEDLWNSRVHPDDRAAVLQGFSDLLTGKVSILTQSFRIVHPVQGERWIEDLVHLRTNDQGLPQKLVGIAIDGTARKRVQEELQRTTALLDLLFETAPIGLGAWDRDLRFMKINKRLAEINGLSPESHIGRRPDELFPHIHQIDHLLDRWREILSTGEPWQNVEITGETPAAPGVVRNWTENFFPLRIGQEIVGIGGVVEETTQRKQAEERLRASEERFRGIYEFAQVGIAITDMEGQFQACNRSFAQVVGYAENELMSAHFADIIHPDDREVNIALLRDLVTQKQPYMEVESRYRRKSGESIWAQSIVSVLRDAADQPASLIIMMTDTTGRKLAEEHVQFLFREVNHRAKNLLSVVLAVVRQTAVHARPEDFADELGSRLQGLAASQDLIINGDWQKVELQELITAQLAHVVPNPDSSIDQSGPSLTVGPAAAQGIGMALHELATNAVKYGALSLPSGKIEIRWSVDSSMFQMRWQERGGPPVVEPKRKGFGHVVATRMVAHSLNGDVDLSFLPNGVIWQLTCPVQHVLSHAGGVRISLPNTST